MPPPTKRTLIRVAAGIIALIVLLWVLKFVAPVMTLVLVSFFFAYLLDPLVDRMEKWKIPRSVASFLVLLAGLLFVVMLILIILPSMIAELAKFGSGAPQYFETLKAYFGTLMTRFEISVPETWDQFWDVIMEKGTPQISKISDIADPAGQVFAKVFESTMSIIGALVYLILIPVLVYYILVSYDEIREHVVDLIPPYLRESILKRLRQMDSIVAGFIRGQFIICLILAFLYTLGFVLVGIDLAVVLGIVSGLLWIIPYVGTLIAVVGGVIMALVKFGDILHPFYIIVWISLVQVLEGYVLTPRIVGGVIGLHPVVYILALIVGANLYGLLGMLIAIPLTAMLKVLLGDAVEMYKQSQLYRDEDRKVEGT